MSRLTGGRFQLRRKWVQVDSISDLSDEKWRSVFDPLGLLFFVTRSIFAYDLTLSHCNFETEARSPKNRLNFPFEYFRVWSVWPKNSFFRFIIILLARMRSILMPPTSHTEWDISSRDFAVSRLSHFFEGIGIGLKKSLSIRLEKF